MRNPRPSPRPQSATRRTVSGQAAARSGRRVRESRDGRRRGTPWMLRAPARTGTAASVRAAVTSAGPSSLLCAVAGAHGSCRGWRPPPIRTKFTRLRGWLGWCASSLVGWAKRQARASEQTQTARRRLGRVVGMLQLAARGRIKRGRGCMCPCRGRAQRLLHLVCVLRAVSARFARPRMPAAPALTAAYACVRAFVVFAVFVLRVQRHGRIREQGGRQCDPGKQDAAGTVTDGMMCLRT